MFDRLLARNTRRKKNAERGNYSFRSRRRRVRLDVRRLDLNPETAATLREKRRKVMRWGFKFAVAVLLLTVVVSVAKIVVRDAFVDSPRFMLQHFSVITDGALQPSEIIAATGLEEGINMLSVPLVQIREKLEQLPQVRRAKVSRGYPGVLFLEVEQRQPVAWLECQALRLAANTPNSGVLLDAEGFVLPSGKVTAEQRKLPVISVEKVTRLAPGQLIGSTQIVAALQLLQTHAASEMADAAITRIDASRAYALMVALDTGVSVVLPAEGFDRQLQRLARVIREAAQQDLQIASVDLLVEKNIPVTLRTTPTGTSAPAQRRPGRTLVGAN